MKRALVIAVLAVLAAVVYAQPGPTPCGNNNCTVTTLTATKKNGVSLSLQGDAGMRFGDGTIMNTAIAGSSIFQPWIDAGVGNGIFYNSLVEIDNGTSTPPGSSVTDEGFFDWGANHVFSVRSLAGITNDAIPYTLQFVATQASDGGYGKIQVASGSYLNLASPNGIAVTFTGDAGLCWGDGTCENTAPTASQWSSGPGTNRIDYAQTISADAGYFQQSVNAANGVFTRNITADAGIFGTYLSVGRGTNGEPFDAYGAPTTDGSMKVIELLVNNSSAASGSPISCTEYATLTDNVGGFTGMGGVCAGKENGTNSNTASYVSMYTHSNGGSNTPYFYISSAGKVGLGSTGIPTETLDVYGPSFADGALTGVAFMVNNTTVATSSPCSGIDFGANVNVSNINGIGGIDSCKENGTNGNTASNLHLYTQANSGSKIAQLSIASTGAATFTSTVAATGFKISSDLAPVVHTANHSGQAAIEFGTDAGTTGVLSVTFGAAFTNLPDCICADNSATPIACGVSARSTTGASFTAVAAGSDNIAFQCFGLR